MKHESKTQWYVWINGGDLITFPFDRLMEATEFANAHYTKVHALLDRKPRATWIVRQLSGEWKTFREGI